MANLCVSDAFLSIRHLLRPQRGHDCRNGIKSATVILASDSRLRVPKRQIDGTKDQRRGFNWMAMSGGNVDFAVVPTSVPVRVAHELLLAGHRFLDVRTPEEFSAGHAVGAVNVPYMFKLGSGMSKNPNFQEEVRLRFGEDDEIIVGCQSGKRSQMAAIELISAGFTGITDIAGGFTAWADNGLPVEG